MWANTSYRVKFKSHCQSFARLFIARFYSCYIFFAGFLSAVKIRDRNLKVNVLLNKLMQDWEIRNSQFINFLWEQVFRVISCFIIVYFIYQWHNRRIYYRNCKYFFHLYSPTLWCFVMLPITFCMIFTLPHLGNVLNE